MGLRPPRTMRLRVIGRGGTFTGFMQTGRIGP
jgi:hypothetical protein